MLAVLRFIGIINAAIWLGAGVFFSFGIAPAVFSPEMKRIFPEYYVGVIGQQLIGPYFTLHILCGCIALAHFSAELFLLQRAFQKWLLVMILVALGVGVMGGFVLQPKMRALFQTKHRGATEAERTRAKKQFGLLHGVSSSSNLITLFVLIAYAWRVSNPPESARFSPKFRS